MGAAAGIDRRWSDPFDGGWSEVKLLRKRGEKQFGDERIPGSGEFVKRILEDVDDEAKERLPAVSMEDEDCERQRKACKESGVSLQGMQNGCCMRQCSALRKLLAVEFVKDLGITYAAAARFLGVSGAAVNLIVKQRFVWSVT